MQGGALNEYAIKEEGVIGNKDYKLYITKQNGNIISPFHEIPLWVEKDKIANMIVEIPKGTTYKLEITKEEKYNPIMHDIKNDKVREVNISWKTENKTYPGHYGALPQTWENPEHVDQYTGQKGDNDPIDAFDISSNPAKSGEVKQVKILGVYAMIDAGETDWKLITISTNDPKANQMNNLEDVEREMPNKLKEIHEFLRDYKKKDANDLENENKFAFEGKAQDRDFAIKIVNETHEEWKKLILGKVEANGINLCTCQKACVQQEECNIL